MQEKYKAMKRKLKKEKELNDQLNKDKETFLTGVNRDSSEHDALRRRLNEKDQVILSLQQRLETEFSEHEAMMNQKEQELQQVRDDLAISVQDKNDYEIICQNLNDKFEKSRRDNESDVKKVASL